MLDDGSQHPFYSDIAIREWKLHIRELEKQEKEIHEKAKKKHGENSKKQGSEGVEGRRPKKSRQPMRMVPLDNEGPKCTPHNQPEGKSTNVPPDEQHSTMPQVPQVWHRHSRTRKPHQTSHVADGE